MSAPTSLYRMVGSAVVSLIAAYLFYVLTPHAMYAVVMFFGAVLLYVSSSRVVRLMSGEAISSWWVLAAVVGCVLSPFIGVVFTLGIGIRVLVRDSKFTARDAGVVIMSTVLALFATAGLVRLAYTGRVGNGMLEKSISFNQWILLHLNPLHMDANFVFSVLTLLAVAAFASWGVIAYREYVEARWSHTALSVAIGISGLVSVHLTTLLARSVYAMAVH